MENIIKTNLILNHNNLVLNRSVISIFNVTISKCPEKGKKGMNNILPDFENVP